MTDEQGDHSTTEATYTLRRTLLVVLLALGAVALVAFAIMSYHGFNLRLEAARNSIARPPS